jgi:hypothetical protein
MSVTGFRAVTIQTMLDPKNAPMIKQYFVADGDGDPTDIYHAQSATASGQDCLHQRLRYNTVSGTKSVQKIDWVKGTWGMNWDI